MDLSKLPRLSESDRHAPTPSSPTASAQDDRGPVQSLQASAVPRDAGVGAEVWLSLIIGIVLMMLGRSFGSYLAATIAHRPFHTGVVWQTGERAGQQVDYWDLEGYTALTDSGIFLFGLVIACEGIVLATVVSRVRAKRAIVVAALVLTVLVTLYNLYAAVKIFGIGLIPLLSILAVGMGGYIASYEWNLLKAMRPARSH